MKVEQYAQASWETQYRPDDSSYAVQVHQIQSGQVIVDLCSVVKELVENSLDAGATSIGTACSHSPTDDKSLDLTGTSEVRFRNHGLDAVEVQDNGDGISSENYESIGNPELEGVEEFEGTRLICTSSETLHFEAVEL